MSRNKRNEANKDNTNEYPCDVHINVTLSDQNMLYTVIEMHVDHIN